MCLQSSPPPLPPPTTITPPFSSWCCAQLRPDNSLLGINNRRCTHDCGYELINKKLTQQKGQFSMMCRLQNLILMRHQGYVNFKNLYPLNERYLILINQVIKVFFLFINRYLYLLWARSPNNNVGRRIDRKQNFRTTFAVIIIFTLFHNICITASNLCSLLNYIWCYFQKCCQAIGDFCYMISSNIILVISTNSQSYILVLVTFFS